MTPRKKAPTPKRIADRSENLHCLNDYKVAWAYLYDHAKPFFEDGKIPLIFTEEEISMLLSVSVSSLQKNRSTGKLSRNKATSLPKAIKVPKIGVRYTFDSIVQWCINLSEQRDI